MEGDDSFGRRRGRARGRAPGSVQDPAGQSQGQSQASDIGAGIAQVHIQSQSKDARFTEDEQKKRWEDFKRARDYLNTVCTIDII